MRRITHQLFSSSFFFSSSTYHGDDHHQWYYDLFYFIFFNFKVFIPVSSSFNCWTKHVLRGPVPLIPCGKFNFLHLGKAATATRAVLPSHTSAWNALKTATQLGLQIYHFCRGSQQNSSYSCFQLPVEPFQVHAVYPGTVFNFVLLLFAIACGTFPSTCSLPWHGFQLRPTLVCNCLWNLSKYMQFALARSSTSSEAL